MKIMVGVETPATDHLKSLAPRVQGFGDYVGEYGYAVAITGDGLIRCFWDEGGWADVPAAQVMLDFGS